MRKAAVVPAVFGFAALVALLFYLGAGLREAVPVAAGHSVWIETNWPFLTDQWGQGRAFQCTAAECGGELSLYIRTKIGFCSSTTGVADDDELERLSDFDFMNGTVVASGDGHEISVASMKGRLRTYAVTSPVRLPANVISVAYNHESDAVVATVVMNKMPPTLAEPFVMEFLKQEAARR